MEHDQKISKLLLHRGGGMIDYASALEEPGAVVR